MACVGLVVDVLRGIRQRHKKRIKVGIHCVTEKMAVAVIRAERKRNKSEESDADVM